MQTVVRNRLLFSSFLTGLAVFAALLVAVAPARAYDPDPTVHWVIQDAGDCAKVRDPDSANTLFELWRDGDDRSDGPLGEIYLGAYGDMLTVVDSRNDGDTFYVWISGEGSYHAPGTSNGRDARTFDLNLTDGTPYAIRITDDRDGRDVIDSTAGSLPYLVP